MFLLSVCRAQSWITRSVSDFCQHVWFTWAHAVLWDLIFGFCPLLASRVNSLNYSESFFTPSSYKSNLCIQVQASWVDINPPKEDSVDSGVVTAEAVDKIASVVAEVENTVQNFYLCPWKGFGLPSSSVRTCWWLWEVYIKTLKMMRALM